MKIVTSFIHLLQAIFAIKFETAIGKSLVNTAEPLTIASYTRTKPKTCGRQVTTYSIHIQTTLRGVICNNVTTTEGLPSYA